MKTIDIREKLKDIGMPLESLSLGEFDHIGEYTAKKERSPGSDLYKRVGAFFRPNYERGLLIYSLIKKYNMRSFLEIGFGRGYGTMCAARAIHENGGGKVVSIDPYFDENHIKKLLTIYPKEWFKLIDLRGGFSKDVLPGIKEKFDFIYIDGDHTYDAVKFDWENTKDKFNKFLLFDDYHMTSQQSNIQCADVINKIEGYNKELIIMDRRIFFDDRRVPDEEINYGQVLVTHGEE